MKSYRRNQKCLDYYNQIKKKIGRRLKQIMDKMNISFTEFDRRLGVKKPTSSSYVQGYNLAPIDVAD